MIKVAPDHQPTNDDNCTRDIVVEYLNNDSFEIQTIKKEIVNGITANKINDRTIIRSWFMVVMKFATINEKIKTKPNDKPNEWDIRIFSDKIPVSIVVIIPIKINITFDASNINVIFINLIFLHKPYEYIATTIK